MRRVILIAAAIALAGCKKDENKPAGTTAPVTPAPTTPSGTVAPMPTTPAPSTAPGPTEAVGSGSSATMTPPPSPTAPKADSTRPASVTDAHVKLADKFIAATEALAKDVAAAGTDCKKATAAIELHKPKLAPIVEEAQQLAEAVENDPAAKQWFQANYIPKMMAAASVMSPITQACMADPAFKAAAGSLPMGAQKKRAAPEGAGATTPTTPPTSR